MNENRIRLSYIFVGSEELLILRVNNFPDEEIFRGTKTLLRQYGELFFRTFIRHLSVQGIIRMEQPHSLQIALNHMFEEHYFN